jgi:hypothetical protein
MKATDIFDPYVLRARVAPVAIASIPVLAVVAPTVLELPLWSKLWPIVLGSGALVLIEQLGRDRGRRLEPALWTSWGGAPTTQLLRYKHNPNPTLLMRRHQQITELTGINLPTEAEERANPEKADEVYVTATAAIKAKARVQSGKFPLIAAENASYGFRRNLLGYRGLAISAALEVAVICIVLLGVNLVGQQSMSFPGLMTAGGVSIIASIFWWLVVRPEWARIPADAYAERLFEALEDL